MAKTKKELDDDLDRRQDSSDADKGKQAAAKRTRKEHEPKLAAKKEKLLKKSGATKAAVAIRERHRRKSSKSSRHCTKPAGCTGQQKGPHYRWLSAQEDRDLCDYCGEWLLVALLVVYVATGITGAKGLYQLPGLAAQTVTALTVTDDRNKGQRLL